ncbi:MAG: VOC family protein [Alphaproteobacteria bacterium]|nr:VOC family protein [Alphaproteobacteria bacterium]
MEKVLGIGGVFFRARDPVALAAWYASHLGVDETPTTYDEPGWRQGGGITVFAPFSENTEYFGDPDRQWMINFRVQDLARMVDQLRSKGIQVEVDAETYPNGRFARLQDPEGNPIQLWQPAGASLDVDESIKPMR